MLLSTILCGTQSKSQIGNVLHKGELAVLDTHFTLDGDGSHLTKLTPKDSPNTMNCAVLLDPTLRTGKKFFRFMFDAKEYNYVNVVGYVHRLAPNVWHTIKCDYTSGCKIWVNATSIYNGATLNIPGFYFHSDVTQLWVDTGLAGDELGTYGGTLPDGYEWY